jgi:hypothetical protein
MKILSDIRNKRVVSYLKGLKYILSDHKDFEEAKIEELRIIESEISNSIKS